MEYAIRHDKKLKYYVVYNMTTDTILIITHHRVLAERYTEEIKNKTRL